MYKIIDNNSCGKTKKLLTVASNDNGIVVCENPRAMEVKAKAYGIHNLKIISYYDCLHDNYDENKPLYIDEIDTFINEVTNGKLAGYTINKEE